MSRIGKKPVEIPDGVSVDIKPSHVEVKGKSGVLKVDLVGGISVKQEDKQLFVVSSGKQESSYWGLVRSLLSNVVNGVSEGFTKVLEVNGVGYRASVKGNILNLVLGYSHDINYALPEGISVKCPKPTIIEISGADKQVVGQVAAEIRSFRPPEPYKGKGVKYSDEIIVRKEGKKK